MMMYLKATLFSNFTLKQLLQNDFDGTLICNRENGVGYLSLPLWALKSRVGNLWQECRTAAHHTLTRLFSTLRRSLLGIVSNDMADVYSCCYL